MVHPKSKDTISGEAWDGERPAKPIKVGETWRNSENKKTCENKKICGANRERWSRVRILVGLVGKHGNADVQRVLAQIRQKIVTDW
jgi:hypothetical protein